RAACGDPFRKRGCHHLLLSLDLDLSPCQALCDIKTRGAFVLHSTSRNGDSRLVAVGRRRDSPAARNADHRGGGSKRRSSGSSGVRLKLGASMNGTGSTCRLPPSSSDTK